MADRIVQTVVDRLYAEEPMPGEPKVYWGAAEIGALFDADGHYVNVCMRRYSPNRTPEQIAKAPTCPQPDIRLGVGKHAKAGWDPATAETLWRAWKASLPGQGAGGGRPSRTISI